MEMRVRMEAVYGLAALFVGASSSTCDFNPSNALWLTGCRESCGDRGGGEGGGFEACLKRRTTRSMMSHVITAHSSCYVGQLCCALETGDLYLRGELEHGGDGV